MCAGPRAFSLRLSRFQRTPTLLKPKYNGQSSAIPFFDRSPRHIGLLHRARTGVRTHVLTHAREIATHRPCSPSRRVVHATPRIYLDDVESESISEARYQYSRILFTLTRSMECPESTRASRDKQLVDYFTKWFPFAGFRRHSMLRVNGELRCFLMASSWLI